MKQEIENLIDRLASKELTFGCWVDCGNQDLTPERRVHVVCGLDMYRDGNYIALLGDGDCASMDLEDAKGQRYGIKTLGHPILIGDVLNKIYPHTPNEKALIDLWYPNDLTQSLQSIFAEAEWEEMECHAGGDCTCRPFRQWKVPKQPAIRELFEFLIKLGL